jgi:hypothetical protein
MLRDAAFGGPQHEATLIVWGKALIPRAREAGVSKVEGVLSGLSTGTEPPAPKTLANGRIPLH